MRPVLWDMPTVLVLARVVTDGTVRLVRSAQHATMRLLTVASVRMRMKAATQIVFFAVQSLPTAPTMRSPFMATPRVGAIVNADLSGMSPDLSVPRYLQC